MPHGTRRVPSCHKCTQCMQNGHMNSTVRGRNRLQQPFFRRAMGRLLTLDLRHHAQGHRGTHTLQLQHRGMWRPMFPPTPSPQLQRVPSRWPGQALLPACSCQAGARLRRPSCCAAPARPPAAAAAATAHVLVVVYLGLGGWVAGPRPSQAVRVLMAALPLPLPHRCCLSLSVALHTGTGSHRQAQPRRSCLCSVRSATHPAPAPAACGTRKYLRDWGRGGWWAEGLAGGTHDGLGVKDGGQRQQAGARTSRCMHNNTGVPSRAILQRIASSPPPEAPPTHLFPALTQTHMAC